MMENILHFLLLLTILLTLVWTVWLNARMQKRNQPDTVNGQSSSDDNAYEGMNTFELAEAVLRKLGCQPQADKRDSGGLYFRYQGEKFSIDTAPGHPFVVVTDAWWYEIAADDIEEFAMVRQAVNICNQNNPYATMLYTFNKEALVVAVHVRTVRLLVWQIPDIEDYLRSCLDVCLQQHHDFYRELSLLRKEQSEPAT